MSASASGGPDGGRLVDDAELTDALAACEAANGDAPITVFEIETAAAFLLFARHPADVVLLEVGLGGRLDATNVIERPLATVITRVSLDHREFLGDTIEQIAAEKAGILKPGVPAIVTGQTREALAVIEHQAARLRAPLAIAGEDWTATEERGRLVYQDDDGLIDLPAPKLYGRHQFENAGAAIAALRASGLKLPAPAFEAGMIRVDWPARMQRLSQGRLPSLLAPESELWLDGGHNADGGRAIAAALADLEERVSRPLVLIVGMLSTKDSEGFLRNFAGLARRIIAVPIHQDKAMPATALADVAQGDRHPRDRARRRRERARHHRQARARAGAAGAHYRLALSGRRSPGRERHAAGIGRADLLAVVENIKSDCIISLSRRRSE